MFFLVHFIELIGAIAPGKFGGISHAIIIHVLIEVKVVNVTICIDKSWFKIRALW